MNHDHGPYDCVPIAALDQIARVASNMNCSLAHAARYSSLCRHVSRLAAAGVVAREEIGKTIELGICAAFRAGEEWARGVLTGYYSPDLGEDWSDDLLEPIVTACEVAGDPLTAARAAAGLIKLPI